MPLTENDTALNQHYNIGLWGPSGSGKTWYISAFARKLRDFQNNPDFYFELFHGDGLVNNYEQENPIPSNEGIPLHVKPGDTTSIAATHTLEDKLWVFRRRPKKDTHSHIISSHVHKINMHDDAGLQTVKLTSNQTIVNLTNSDFLLIMLDPTKLSNFRGTKLRQDRETNLEDHSDASAVYEPYQYAEMVGNLFQVLLANPRPKRHIAVCITKIDQLSVKEREPWELIQMFFEKELYDVLRPYKDSDKFKLQTFAFSAMGYYNEGTTRKPNYDVLTGKLEKPGEWRPHNVEAPLFWLFESIELGKLRNERTNPIAKMLFHSDREKLYIRYTYNRK